MSAKAPDTPPNASTPASESLLQTRWPNVSIDEVFGATARSQANRPAIRTRERQVTYAELDTRAEHISKIVAALDDPSDGQIALLFEPGIEAIAAIFGTLRAGRVYVPLDPADPPQRVEFILKDSLSGAILTDGAHLERAKELAGDSIQVINIDAANARTPVVPIPPKPDSIAYIFYTSGSTGQPKGVMQSHQNLLHFAGNYSLKLDIQPGDRLSFLYSMSFSAANMDIYGGLLNGATLMPFDVRQRGTAELAAWLRQEQITILHCVPTLYRNLGEYLDEETKIESVRAIDLGGEPVFWNDAKLLKAHFRGDCPLINHLAATEASVIAQNVVKESDEELAGTVPVGPAAPGVAIRITREDGTEAAVGESGEIVISSPFLSPGYFGREDLTRAAFGVDPTRPGWRTYRTGDVGKLDEHENLHALGRKDARVKIRGHSVYPAEVEAALRETAGVQDAVVVAIRVEDEESSEFKLVAYAVTNENPQGSLRRALAGRLPGYMLPSEINLLDAFPLTATGKIDRKILSGADRPRTPQEREFIEPANSVEEKVAEVFGSMLGLAKVGRTDDFFELGGTSLKIAGLQLDLKRAFGKDIPLSELIKEPTVCGIAQQIKRLRKSTHFDSSVSPYVVALREEGTRPPLFLVHGAYGQAFVSPAFLDLMGDDQPLYGFQARGIFGTEKPHTRIADMATDYIMAMRKIRPEGPYFIGGICAGSMVAHEMACRLEEQGVPLAPLLLIDPPVPQRRELTPSRRFYEMLLLRLSLLGFNIGPAGEIAKETRSTLRKHGNRGRIAYDHKDVARRKAAVSTAIRFRIALMNHAPRVYGGTTRVLANRHWLNDDQRKGVWMGYLKGDVQLFAAGEVHHEVLNPGNPIFAESLRKVMDEAHANFGTA